MTLPADIGILARKSGRKEAQAALSDPDSRWWLASLDNNVEEKHDHTRSKSNVMAERQGSPGSRVDQRSSPRAIADHNTIDIEHEMRNEWDYVQYQQDNSRTTSHKRLQSGTTDEDWHDCISSYDDDGIVGQSDPIHGTCLQLLHSGRHLPFSVICQMCTRLVLILHRPLLPAQEFLDSLTICKLPI